PPRIVRSERWRALPPSTRGSSSPRHRGLGHSSDHPCWARLWQPTRGGPLGRRRVPRDDSLPALRQPRHGHLPLPGRVRGARVRVVWLPTGRRGHRLLVAIHGRCPRVITLVHLAHANRSTPYY